MPRDRRFQYERTLYFVSIQLTASFNARERSHVAQACTNIALGGPIRSAQQLRERRGVGEKTIANITGSRVAAETAFPGQLGAAPARGRFASFGPAVLVALLDTSADGDNGSSSAEGALALSELRVRARALMEPSFAVNEGTRIDVENFILASLESGSWSPTQERVVKSFQRHGEKHVLLSQEGTRTATRMKQEAALPPEQRASEAPLIDTTSSTAPGSASVALLVDSREGGQEHLKRLCDFFARASLPMRTRSLPSGDYMFVVIEEGKRDRVLPLIIERKTASDFGESVRDGRYPRQLETMKVAVTCLRGIPGTSLQDPMSVILLEGRVFQECICGCRCTPGCREAGYPHVDDVKEKVRSLQEKGLLVQTDHMHGTAAYFQEWHKLFVQLLHVRKDLSLPTYETYRTALRGKSRSADYGAMEKFVARDSEPVNAGKDGGSFSSASDYQVPTGASCQAAGSTRVVAQDRASLAALRDRLMEVDMSTLKQWCMDRGYRYSGSKSSLASELAFGKPLPPLLLARKKQKLWCPRRNSSLAAMLVCMDRGDVGAEWTKDEIMSAAEASDLSDQSVFGEGAGTGKPFHYDGWSGFQMNMLADEVGEGGLAAKVRRSRPTRFILTQRGRKVARAVHQDAHFWPTPCKCGLVVMHEDDSDLRSALAEYSQRGRKVRKRSRQTVITLSGRGKLATAAAEESPSCSAQPGVLSAAAEVSFEGSLEAGSQGRLGGGGAAGASSSARATFAFDPYAPDPWLDAASDDDREPAAVAPDPPRGSSLSSRILETTGVTKTVTAAAAAVAAAAAEVIVIHSPERRSFSKAEDRGGAIGDTPATDPPPPAVPGAGKRSRADGRETKAATAVPVCVPEDDRGGAIIDLT